MKINQKFNSHSLRIEETIHCCIEKNPLLKKFPFFSKTSSTSHYDRNPLNKETFLLEFSWSEGNKILIKSILESLSQKNSLFKNIFFSGNRGIGKTSLLKTIKKKIPKNKKVILLSAKTFSKIFSLSLKDGKIHEFREKFRNIDVLLIDDFQMFSGKEKTSKEFLFTFDELKHSGCVTIFASSQPVFQLKNLKTSMINRLQAMLSLEMSSPPVSFIKNIILFKSLKKKLCLPQKTVDSMALFLKGYLHLLDQVIEHLQSLPGDILLKHSYEDVKKILKKFFNKKIEKSKEFDSLVQKVCDYFQISFEDLRFQKKKKLTKIRYVCIFLGEYFQHDHKEISVFFQYKSLKSIRSVLRKCLEYQKKDVQIAKDIQNLVKIIRKNSEKQST